MPEKADLPVDPLSDEPPVDGVSVEWRPRLLRARRGRVRHVGDFEQSDTPHQRRLGLGRGAGGVHASRIRSSTSSTSGRRATTSSASGCSTPSSSVTSTRARCRSTRCSSTATLLDERQARRCRNPKGNGIDSPETVMRASTPSTPSRYWAASTSVGEDFPYQREGACDSRREAAPEAVERLEAGRLADARAAPGDRGGGPVGDRPLAARRTRRRGRVRPGEAGEPGVFEGPGQPPQFLLGDVL